MAHSIQTEPPSPKNVVVYKINSTAINVTWDKQTLVELKGLADYTVEYSMAVSNQKRQILSGVVTVPWTESNILITNLTPGVQYDVSVSVATSVGMSGKFFFVFFFTEYHVHNSNIIISMLIIIVNNIIMQIKFVACLGMYQPLLLQ